MEKKSLSGVLPYDLLQVHSLLSRLIFENILEDEEKNILNHLGDIVSSLDWKLPIVLRSDEDSILWIQEKIYSILRLLDQIQVFNTENEVLVFVKHKIERSLKSIEHMYRKQTTLFYSKVDLEKALGHKGGLFDNDAYTIAANDIKENTSKFQQTLLDLTLISIDEKIRIAQYCLQEIFDDRALTVNFLEKTQSSGGHLLRNKSKAGLNYIQAPYTISTFFAYEIPHVITHFKHLDLLPGTTLAYNDEISKRSFLEGVAVLSEKYFLQQLLDNSTLADNLYECLSKNHRGMVSKSVFSKLLIYGRKKECQLRAVRLLADIYAQQGKSQGEVSNIISKEFGLSHDLIVKEIGTYRGLTGLGSIYTIGYKRLENAGFLDPNGVCTLDLVPSTWDEFEDIIGRT